MQDLLDFKTKKDRDDFYIAIVVIALFLSFFSWMIGCEDTMIPEEIAAVAPTVIASDKDNDGIPDATDNCPELTGIALNGGCPADADGDGIYDTADACPDVAGTEANAGCPKDTDKDGVADAKDKCPELAGVKANGGCPADSDGDGVYDINDKCPDRFGDAERDGCPEAKLEEAERTLLAAAMKNVEFQTGSAKLKSSSTAVLDKIADLMKKYPSYKLDINGHTDNVGDPVKNLGLSKARAQSCLAYLQSIGIAKQRISFKGYGSKQPIDSNDSADGRARNRRVEFKLHY